MDRQEKKKTEGGSENGSENGSHEDSDVEDKVSESSPSIVDDENSIIVDDFN